LVLGLLIPSALTRRLAGLAALGLGTVPLLVSVSMVWKKEDLAVPALLFSYTRH
jgi:hypothetical protein